MSKAGKWNNASLTPDGQELQARLLNGGGFEFTKATAADETGVDKLTLTMHPPVVSGNKITVPVLLSNMGLDAGFTMTQLRFYARKTGGTPEEEVLYAIAQDNTGDYIPSAVESAGFTSDWSYTFQFGNADTVNVSIDPAGLVSLALLGAPGGIATLDEGGKLPKAQLTEITGDDIKTSATDETTVSSSLSNTIRTPVEIQANADLNNYTSAGLFFCLANAQSVLNIPPSSIAGAFSLFVEYSGAYGNGCKQTFTEHNPGITYIRRMSDVSAGHWSNWEPLATATKPQEFDLPLAEGWSGWAKYSKDQFGRVLVYGLVAKSTALISGDVIGTFPEGFRPSATCPMTITSGNANDGKSFATSGYVQPSGVLTLSNGTISSVYKLGNNLAFNFVFTAAD